MSNTVQKRTVILDDVCIADGGTIGVFNTRTDEIYAIDKSHPDQCNFSRPLTLSATATSPRSPEINALFRKLSISSLEGSNLSRYKRLLFTKQAENAAERKDYKVYGLLFNATKMKAGKLDRAGTAEMRRLLSAFNLKGLALKIAERLPEVDLYTIPDRKQWEGSVYLSRDLQTGSIESSARKADRKICIDRKIINFGSSALFDSPESDLYFSLLEREFGLSEIFADVMGDMLIYNDDAHRDRVIYLDSVQGKIKAISEPDFKKIFLEKIETQVQWRTKLVQQATLGESRRYHQDQLNELIKLKQFVESSN